MAFEHQIGDYTYRAEKLPDGKYNFSRKLDNTPGAQFEEVPWLNDVPAQLITAFKEWRSKQDKNIGH